MEEAWQRISKNHPLEDLPVERVLPGLLGWLLGKFCCFKKLAVKQQVRRGKRLDDEKKAYNALVRRLNFLIWLCLEGYCQ